MSSVLYDAPGPKAKRRQFLYSILGAIVIAGGLGLLLWTLGRPRIDFAGNEKPGMFDPSRWDVLGNAEVWGSIWQGVWATLSAAGVATVLAILFGIMMSMLASAESKWIRIPTTILLEFFRGMPVLLMMLFLLL
ncbi:MAG: amino acid ABC transporter permease, partial [Microbacteriaceae bacterium]